MKRNRMCGVVEDLLPSYLEELTNDTSKEMVEAHLLQCEECRKYKENLEQSKEQELLREESITKRFRRKLSRYRYQLFGAFLGMILAVVAIVGSIFLAFVYIKQSWNVDSHTERVEDYGEFDEYVGPSKLYVFPDTEIRKDEEVVIQKYIYDCGGNAMYPTCQIFLECQYSEEAYRKEQERLMEVRGEETQLSIKYTTEDFEKPAVYAMRNCGSSNEYVLFLEKEKKMIYVYLQGCVDRRDLLFAEEYLPLGYGQNGLGNEEGQYSIYPREDWY